MFITVILLLSEMVFCENAEPYFFFYTRLLLFLSHINAL